MNNQSDGEGCLGIGCFTIVIIAIIGYFMDKITELLDGKVYYLLIILSMIWVIFYLTRIPIYKAKEREKIKKVSKRNAALLEKEIQKLYSSELTIDCPEQIPSEPHQLTLDEQFKYLKELDTTKFELTPKLKSVYNKTHMTLEEMENQIHKNLEKISNSDFIYKCNSHLYGYHLIKLYNKEFGKHFFKKFGVNEDIFKMYQEISPIFLMDKKLEELNNKKNNLIWNINQGVMGEKRTLKDMELYITKGQILNSVRIEYKDRSAESDLIYVGPTGVYSFEVKNYGTKSNWSIRVNPDGLWRKVYSDGTEEPMNSVGSQVTYHIAVKERFLNEKLKERYGDDAPEIKVKGAVIMANDIVMVENESSLPIIRISGIREFLEKEEDILTPEWQERIIEIFKEYTQKGKSYEIPNFEAELMNCLSITTHLEELYQLRYGWLKKLDEKIMKSDEDVKGLIPE